MLTITNLKALYGDSFLVRSNDGSINFLVDCGYKKTYIQEIRKITNDVDFIILTHVDEDHIYGAIPLINDYPEKFNLRKVFINTPDSCKLNTSGGGISIGQSITLEELLKSKCVDYASLIQGQDLQISDECNLKVVSPASDDLAFFNKKYKLAVEARGTPSPISIFHDKFQSIEALSLLKDSFKSKGSDFINVSSIAFIMEYKSNRVLFLGDSHPLGACRT